MSNLLEGKLALILGIANKWSLAYAIAQAFWREGATLALTYLGDRQKVAIEEFAQGMPLAGLWPCDVTKEEDLLALTESLRALGRPLDAVVHSLAFANRDDLSRPFVETGRAGFLLAQEVSSYSLVAVARATIPMMSAGGALMTLTYLGTTRGIKDFTTILDNVAQRSPLRRNTDPAEVADTAVFLASDLGRGVTGNTIFVDAGIQIMGL